MPKKKKPYERLGVLSYDDVKKKLWPLIEGKTSRQLNGKTIEIIPGVPIKIGSLRYRIFFRDDGICKECARTGSYFAIERHWGNTCWHLNLYSADDIMFTKDHIVPKCEGGTNNLENLQTLCSICNQKKGALFSHLKS